MKKQPEGYAPDLFSEHARAAQFGLVVVRMLREWSTMPRSDREDTADELIDDMIEQARGACFSVPDCAEEATA